MQHRTRKTPCAPCQPPRKLPKTSQTPLSRCRPTAFTGRRRQHPSRQKDPPSQAADERNPYLEPLRALTAIGVLVKDAEKCTATKKLKEAVNNCLSAIDAGYWKLPMQGGRTPTSPDKKKQHEQRAYYWEAALHEVCNEVEVNESTYAIACGVHRQSHLPGWLLTAVKPANEAALDAPTQVTAACFSNHRLGTKHRATP